MTKLETVKEQVRQKVGDKAFDKLSQLIGKCEFPPKAESKMWQKVLDGEKIEENSN